MTAQYSEKELLKQWEKERKDAKRKAAKGVRMGGGCKQ